MEINIGNIIVEEEINIGDIELDVIKEYPILENLTVTPTNEQQTFTHPNSYGYDNVTVNAVELQDKTVTPTKEKQTILADDEYAGLNEVTIEAVTNEIDSNIVAENIKNGVDILGVTGNFIGSKYAPKRISFYKYDGTNLDYELSILDTSKVTDMSYMFYDCSNLTSLDLSNFDTSNVERINDMFYRCNDLTSLDLSNFDTSNVTTLQNTFMSCSRLTSLDVSSFDTSNVKSMYNTFYSCKNLTSLDLSNFDASSVYDPRTMIYQCTNLTNLIFMNNLGKGYTSKTTNYSNYQLDLHYSKNLTHESLMDVINKLYDLNLTYDVANGGTLYTQQLVLGSENMAKLTSEEIAIATNKGWVVN